MQQDARRLTVAYEHLRTACSEVASALEATDPVMAEAAATRALSHLDLIWRRLEQERARDIDRTAALDVERAYNASRLAWQGLHDILNTGTRRRAAALEQVQADLQESMDALERRCGRLANIATEPAPEQVEQR